MKVVNREVLLNQSTKVDNKDEKDIWTRLSNAAKELWVRDDNLLGVKMGMNDYAVTVDGAEFMESISVDIKEHDVVDADFIRVLNHDEAVGMKKIMKYKLA